MANLLHKVLNETSSFPCLLQSSSNLVYQLHEFVRDTAYNLSELSSVDDYYNLPPTVKMIEGDSEEDSMLVQAAPMNVPLKVTVFKKNSLDRSLDFFIINLVQQLYKRSETLLTNKTAEKYLEELITLLSRSSFLAITCPNLKRCILFRGKSLFERFP